jgi:hypothetical protein
VVETPPDLVEIVRILMAELQSCKADNERLIKEHKNKLKLMKSYYKAYHIYRGSCNMDQQPVMWTNIILRKLKVHLTYKSMVMKVARQGGEPQRRPNMEPRDTQRKNPLVRKLTTPRNLLVEKLVRIPRGE